MKTKILHAIPNTLLYSRLVVAILMIIFSFINISVYLIITLSIYAIISDIFDGMIARYLKISNLEMRKMDTKIDTVFWFSCLFYICIHHSAFIQQNLSKFIILTSSEIMVIIMGFLKFQERISYHTIISKFWALLLAWFFIDLIFDNLCSYSFLIAFWYGIFSQIEILIIIILLKVNQTDIPSIFHAIKLRRGIAISRNKLFNG